MIMEIILVLAFLFFLLIRMVVVQFLVDTSKVRGWQFDVLKTKK